MKHGKNYVNSSKKVDRGREYEVDEACALLKEAKFAKFDETVELHIRLGVDPRHADQQVRGVVALPHGTGKQVRVLVFTEGGGVKEAEGAGADVVGVDWRTPLDAARTRIPPSVALQGNLDPSVLFGSPEAVAAETKKVLDSYGPHAGHVFNLGHGIRQFTPLEHVAAPALEPR